MTIIFRGLLIAFEEALSPLVYWKHLTVALGQVSDVLSQPQQPIGARKRGKTV